MKRAIKIWDEERRSLLLFLAARREIRDRRKQLEKMVEAGGQAPLNLKGILKTQVIPKMRNARDRALET